MRLGETGRMLQQRAVVVVRHVLEGRDHVVRQVWVGQQAAVVDHLLQQRLAHAEGHVALHLQ